MKRQRLMIVALAILATVSILAFTVAAYHPPLPPGAIGKYRGWYIYQARDGRYFAVNPRYFPTTTYETYATLGELKAYIDTLHHRG